MKFNKKIRIFALACALFVLLFTVAAFATDVGVDVNNENVVSDSSVNDEIIKNPPKDTMIDDFGERFEFALVGTVTGMLAVFTILSLLWGIISLSKVFLYDIPNREKNKGKKENKNAHVPAPTAAPAPVAEPAHAVAPAAEESADDGEIAAVITAAIAAMLDSEEYKNEFVGGFRVVSFKRSANSAWNKK